MKNEFTFKKGFRMPSMKQVNNKLENDMRVWVSDYIGVMVGAIHDGYDAVEKTKLFISFISSKYLSYEQAINAYADRPKEHTHMEGNGVNSKKLKIIFSNNVVNTLKSMIPSDLQIEVMGDLLLMIEEGLVGSIQDKDNLYRGKKATKKNETKENIKEETEVEELYDVKGLARKVMTSVAFSDLKSKDFTNNEDNVISLYSIHNQAVVCILKEMKESDGIDEDTLIELAASIIKSMEESGSLRLLTHRISRWVKSIHGGPLGPFTGRTKDYSKVISDFRKFVISPTMEDNGFADLLDKEASELMARLGYIGESFLGAITQQIRFNYHLNSMVGDAAITSLMFLAKVAYYPFVNIKK